MIFVLSSTEALNFRRNTTGTSTNKDNLFPSYLCGGEYDICIANVRKLIQIQCAEFRNILKDAVPVTRAFHFIVS